MKKLTEYNSFYILKNSAELFRELILMGFIQSSTYLSADNYIWVSGRLIYSTDNVGLEVPEKGSYFGPYGISCKDD